MATSEKDLPVLAGTGGRIKDAPEDFVVEEVPAYTPSGSGEHTFLFIEKRALSTQEALRLLCRALALREADAGVAGQKDKQALTRQWISLPRVAPEQALGMVLESGAGHVRVLSAARHGNKLRTGHLLGNRFTLTLRDTEAADAVARARAILAALERRGLPNRYGDQRFGQEGRNAEDGRRLCRGELRVSDRFRRRFLVSAYQSALFNRYLLRRQEEGLLRTVLVGDILAKRDSGGLFAVGSEGERDAAQPRVDSGEVAVTGPMFGSRMKAPPPGSPASLREEALLREEGLEPAAFAGLGAIAEGTRRPLVVPIGLPGAGPAAEADPEDPRAVVLRFALPAGSYATVLLEEVIRGASSAAR